MNETDLLRQLQKISEQMMKAAASLSDIADKTDKEPKRNNPRSKDASPRDTADRITKQIAKAIASVKLKPIDLNDKVTVKDIDLSGKIKIAKMDLTAAVSAAISVKPIDLSSALASAVSVKPVDLTSAVSVAPIHLSADKMQAAIDTIAGKIANTRLPQPSFAVAKVEPIQSEGVSRALDTVSAKIASSVKALPAPRQTDDIIDVEARVVSAGKDVGTALEQVFADITFLGRSARKQIDPGPPGPGSPGLPPPPPPGGGSGAGAADDFSQQILKTTKTLGIFGFMLATLNRLHDPLRDIIRDFYMLQARGISGYDNLLDLYWAAAKAGMSLQDYTAMLESNTVSLARSGSLAEYNKALEDTSEKLGYLGIFGSSARQLSATMASSATMIGVPQEQLSGVIDNQISVFEDLRKSTMMTAEGFDHLVKRVADNANVQEELMGMAPHERAARFIQLTQTAALGEQMGLTKEQSARLADALMAQRRLTAVDRFKSAGMMRMGGSIMGMGAAETEELSRLSLKKNKTTEEQQRFVQLGGKFQQGLEKMQNSGNIAQQNIADQLQAMIPGATASALEESGKALMTQQSGPVIQKDFAASTSEFAQAVAEFGTAITGMMKSPLFGLLTGLGTSVFQLGMALMVMKKLNKIGGLAGAASSAASGPGVFTKIKDTVAAGTKFLWKAVSEVDILKPFKWVGNTIASGSKWLYTTLKSFSFAGAFDGLKSLFSSVSKLGSVVATSVKGASNMFGPVLSAMGKAARLLKFIPVIGNIISMFVEGIGEVFTGTIDAAFNGPDGGGIVSRIGNVLYATLSGLAGGIFEIGDWLVESLTGKDIGLRSAFDKVATFLRGGFFTILAKVSDILPDFLGGNKLSEYFTQAADNSFKVLDQLNEKEGATVASIGKENLKIAEQQKESAKTAQDATKKTTGAIRDNIVWGVENVGAAVMAAQQAGSAQIAAAKAERIAKEKAGEKPVSAAIMKATAATAQSPEKVARLESSTKKDTTGEISSQMTQLTAVGQARIQAVPTLQMQTPITPPEVNKPVEDKPAPEVTEATKTTEGAIQQVDIVAVLQQQLSTLQQLLAVAQDQAGLSEDAIKKMGRVKFDSNAQLFAAASGLARRG